MSIEPGLRYDLANDDYHADTEWLSSSVLKRLLPEHYKAGGSQDALDFGTLFHTVVLEPDNLAGYVVLDAAAIAGDNPKTGRPYDSPTMTAKYKAAVAEAAQGGRIVVAQDAWDKAHAMRDAVVAHSDARALIYDGAGANEESAFWADESGVKHKARFDRRIPGALVDLKSTSAKPGLRSLTNECISWGYDFSAAHYLAVAAGLKLDAETFLHVWVEKVEPYRVTVTELDLLFVMRGRTLRDQALERHHKQAEPYEGATGRLTLICPEWALPHDDEMEIA